MTTRFAFAALALFTASAAYSQDLAGDWQGTLKAGPTELRLVFRLSKRESGWQGALDSIDQNANGLRLDAIKWKAPKLSFAVPSVRGLYDGKFNAAGTAIEGVWSQGAEPLPLNFTRVPPNANKPATSQPVTPSDIDGAWTGTLEAGGATLRLVFHITTTAGGLTATLDSLDQDAKGIPATCVTRTGATLKIEFKQLAGAFEGSIYKGPASITGTWTQMGTSNPLVLAPAK